MQDKISPMLDEIEITSLLMLKKVEALEKEVEEKNKLLNAATEVNEKLESQMRAVRRVLERCSSVIVADVYPRPGEATIVIPMLHNDIREALKMLPGTDDLTTTELEILEEINGDRKPRPWGAHVAVCLEFLHGRGYITAEFGGKLTQKGVACLEKSKEEAQGHPATATSHHDS